ncbi:PUA domain (predicted RNA-binding domain) [Thiorhodovibrio winogradskyi]|uniref:PUA domain (Predicted RNA-binding domain) n=1 Tax=Thiorhodovibrio winogradskyi TaxID=77007 RepID=A0ABZ0SBD7_9GAMM|nr:phosphoadenosine phosphosulfate reductase family protein [Thiorhodovibrio winogradskyi]
MTDLAAKPPVRHLLGLSGGKDSSALAIYMRDRVPEMEYFFADTGAELPETLEFIDLLQDYLGKPIVRLNSARSFDYYLKFHKNYLPSPKQRWCTFNLKLLPFEEFVGNDKVISYVAIRADEPDRAGYISSKRNIRTRFPFKEDGLTKDDIQDILESAGLGMPRYYEWRSRSGCYFCFFQRREEWAGLKQYHPDLYERAKAYEKADEETGKVYTWNQSGTLDELVERAEKAEPVSLKNKPSRKLIDRFGNSEDDEDHGCILCSL